MKAITLYIGLDVHKDSITIAIAQPGPKGEIRRFGTITNHLHAPEKALIGVRPAFAADLRYSPHSFSSRSASRASQTKVPDGTIGQ